MKLIKKIEFFLGYPGYFHDLRVVYFDRKYGIIKNLFKKKEKIMKKGDDPYSRNYSDIDPYGEENWNDDEQPDWNKTGDNHIYRRFVVPIGDLTREQAERQIQELMSEYHDDVQWDENTGSVSINGETNSSF